MRKLYILIITLGCLFTNSKLSAQCSVTISTNTNTTQLNCTNTSITLTANATGTAPITYLWSTGETTRSIIVSKAGTDTVTITANAVCSTSTFITIAKDTIAPIVSVLAFPESICLGGSATLIGLGAATYSWLPGVITGPVVTVSPNATTIYTLTGNALNGCTHDTSFSLVVNPLPTATITGSTAVCQNATAPLITFSGLNGIKPYTFTYRINGGANQTITTTGTNDAVAVIAATGTTGLINYNLISVADSTGCTQPQTGTAVINVLNGPLLTSTKTATICTNTPFTYSATSVASNTSFSWQRPVVAGIGNSAGSGSSATINETLNNTTEQPVTIIYLFSLSTGTGCVTTDSLVLTVNPTPVLNSITNKSYCNGAFAGGGITFSSSSPVAGFTWVNSNPNIGLPANGTGNIPAFIATNTGASAITATITVSIKASADSCPGTSKTFTISVLPAPVLTSSKTASICDNESFNYTATSSAAGTTFSWTRAVVTGINNPANSGNTATISETFNNTTNQPVEVKYVITLFTGTGCVTIDTLKLMVNPTPVLNSITNRSYCNGEFVVGGITFLSSSPDAGFTWVNSNPNIGLPANGTGNIPAFIATNTGASAIAATITVYIKASTDSCPGTSRTFTISVLPAPVLTSSKTTSICDNAAFNYSATSSAANTSFSWTRAFVTGINNAAASGATGTISETLDNTTDQPVVVNYIFTLSTGTGCVTTDSLKLTVNPTPVTNTVTNKTYCNGEFVIGGIPFLSSSPGTVFGWINSDTTIGLAASGTGNISPFNAKNTTANSVTATITVFIKASADSCAGIGTSFTITVLPAPVITSRKAASICDNAAFSYIATSSAAGTSFSWIRPFIIGINNAASSGITATISETLHNTTDQPVEVKYIFTLSTGTGCVTTDSLKLTVNPTPIINKINDTIFCNSDFARLGIPFTSSSPGSGFSWLNSDTTIGLAAIGSGSIPPFIPKNNTSNPVMATITVFVKASSDSCTGASTTFNITVLPAPVLTSSKTTGICNNAAFTYQASSSAANTSFSWTRAFVTGINNAASGGVTASISETLNNTTDQPVVIKYIFTLSTGTGCITTDSLQVTVNPTPATNTVTNKFYCNAAFVTGGIPFFSSSPGAGFSWLISDTTIGLAATGSGNIPPFIAKNTTGNPVTATITVFIKASIDSCAGASTTFTITVLPAPVLTSTKDTSSCNNNLFAYTATSSSSDANTSFRWKRDLVTGISNPAHADTLAKFINETLHNITSQPIIVKYLFTLSTGNGCDTTETLNVTVNPTPVINLVRDTAYCNGSLAQPILFTSPSPNATITWTSDTQIGFGISGSSSIPAFIARNPDSKSVVAKVTVQIKASSDSCQGRDTTFTITVLPTPFLTGNKTASICNADPFVYTAKSFTEKTTFSWTRDIFAGISNAPLLVAVNDSTINETLNNITDTPIIVTYQYSLSTGTGTGCNTNDSIKVTVNPTPKINTETIKPYKYCNLEKVNAIKFSSISPNSFFRWTTDTSIGFGLSGKDSIPTFTASNSGITQITSTVRVYITASSDSCQGRDTTFSITVNPSAPKPNFTSLSRYADKDILKLCSGSNNINFNINVPVNGISYKWISPVTDGTILSIRDNNDANTVVSFFKPGEFIINAVATNTSNGGCIDTVSQTVQINATNGIDERKIFEKNPGNILIYPDNSLDTLTGYQWGYDSVITISPNASFDVPRPIQGQVYQFFIPAKRFIENNTLDTIRRSYWVLLRQGECVSKVYYNGPYANRPAQITPVNNEVRVQVFPNPNRGNFEIALIGNIYGSIDAKIYNSMGQVVFRKNFIKMMPEVNENFSTTNLPGGLYFIELNSSNLKKIVTRFIIQQ